MYTLPCNPRINGRLRSRVQRVIEVDLPGHCGYFIHKSVSLENITLNEFNTVYICQHLALRARCRCHQPLEGYRDYIFLLANGLFTEKVALILIPNGRYFERLNRAFFGLEHLPIIKFHHSSGWKWMKLVRKRKKKGSKTM